MKALILAAGYATRLYPLTQNFPKPLLQVGRQSIIDYLMDRISTIPGLDEVIVVSNSKFTPFFKAWADLVNSRSESKPLIVSVIDNGTDSNETRLGAIADMVHAITLAAIHEDLLVTAGDNIYLFDFRKMYRFFKEKNSDVILTHRIKSEEKLRRSGILQMDEHQRVIGFEEKPQTPKSDLVCPALYFFKKETLTLIADYLDSNGNPDAPGHFIAWLYRQHPIYAYLMTEPYYDIGNLESYQSVCRQFEDPAFSY